MSQVHNLDESLQEYFEFILGGFRYKFRHLNSDEFSTFLAITKEGDEIKAREFFYQFISSDDEKAPPFSKAAKKMIMPQWNRFTKMITTELSA